MNITNHAKERYVERIQGMTKVSDIKQYIAQNEDRVERYILELYKYSDKIFTGQIGGDKTTKDFHLNGDTCLVVGNGCIQTIYKINFALPEETRLMVIADLKREIQDLQEQIQAEETSLADKTDATDTKIGELQSEINGLYEEIEIKKTDIEMLQAVKKSDRNELRRLNKYLQHYAEQLFGNTQYKKDVC